MEAEFWPKLDAESCPGFGLALWPPSDWIVLHNTCALFSGQLASYYSLLVDYIDAEQM